MAEAGLQQRQRGVRVAYKHVPSIRVTTPPRLRESESASVASAAPIAPATGAVHAAAAAIPSGTETSRPRESDSASVPSAAPIASAAGAVYAAAGAIRSGTETSRPSAQPADSALSASSLLLGDDGGRGSIAGGGLGLAVGAEESSPALSLGGFGSQVTMDITTARATTRLPVERGVLELMSQALDEEIERLHEVHEDMSGFVWSGAMDAAKAAWIGGTWLLRYGELMPGGVARAMMDLADEGEPLWPLPRCVPASSSGASAPSADPSSLGVLGAGVSDSGQPGGSSSTLVLELGMGRGRLALQLFLLGATVIGVELASQRYATAATSLERLAHRCPEDFEISRRTPEALRIRRQIGRGGRAAALMEIRLGDFFKVISKEEVRAATIVVCQVFLPPPTWPKVRNLLLGTSAGCRVLLYEELEKMWEGAEGPPCPFQRLASPRLSCSWAPVKGHVFYCYQRRSLKVLQDVLT